MQLLLFTDADNKEYKAKRAVEEKKKFQEEKAEVEERERKRFAERKKKEEGCNIF